MLSRTLIQVPFIARMTSLNNDDDGRQDEFGRSPDNEIKAVTPTGNTSTTLYKEEARMYKYKIHMI